MKEAYLGDSVYVKWIDGDLHLYTYNGVGVENEIYLEPEVWEALKRFVESLQ